MIGVFGVNAQIIDGYVLILPKQELHEYINDNRHYQDSSYINFDVEIGSATMTFELL